jgi:hypothetical protein
VVIGVFLVSDPSHLTISSILPFNGAVSREKMSSSSFYYTVQSCTVLIKAGRFRS